MLTGDEATVLDDGSIQLFGRGSMCINTGGEKVFPEEVEGVIVAHPDVYDVLVVGVDDPRWGRRWPPSSHPSRAPTLTAEDARGALPREARRLQGAAAVDASSTHVQRSPSGKADYAWAKQEAAS